MDALPISTPSIVPPAFYSGVAIEFLCKPSAIRQYLYVRTWYLLVPYDIHQLAKDLQSDLSANNGRNGEDMRTRIAWEWFQKEWFESKWLRHLVGGFAAFLEFFTVEFSQFFSMCLLR